MSAKFLRRGAYQVSYLGQSITVIANHPCVALQIAARIFRIGYETEPEAA